MDVIFHLKQQLNLRLTIKNKILRGNCMAIKYLEYIKVFEKDKLIHYYYLCRNVDKVLGYYDFVTECFMPCV